MKRGTKILQTYLVLNVMLLLVFAVASAPAAVRYVNVNNAAANPPYLTWATAATNIQDAVDVAVSGDEIVVTNGVYRSGERVSGSGLGTGMNRVTVTKPVTLRSVNGPGVTVIDGLGAARCVYLTNGAALIGFTLTNGAAASVGSQGFIGGGVFCESTDAVVFGCILTHNLGATAGGAYGGTLSSCTLNDNSAVFDAGGAYSCTLINCNVAGNSAGASAGGVEFCRLTNCIVYFNNASNGENNYRSGLFGTSSTFDHCCATPVPPGPGNISADPQLTSFSHISALSPCRGAGNPAAATGVDIDGEPWANPPSIGCDEVHPGLDAGPLAVALKTSFANFVTGYEAGFAASIDGYASANRWEFGDGTVLSNRVVVTHAWATPGDYQVTVSAFNQSNPSGVNAIITVHVAERQTHFVATDSLNPVTPYLSWATAATNIQEALDVALVGEEIVVTNGVYSSGENVGPAYSGTNRVGLTKPMKLRSVNGPDVTVIDGLGVVRCVYLTNGATLTGFTLTNGIANWGTRQGGGVFCESTNSIVSDCVLAANWADEGGGAFGSTLNNCVVTGNAGNYGGGTYGGALNNCILATNVSTAIGGGAALCTLNGCAIIGNINEFGQGGGTFGSTLNNCTVVGNAVVSNSISGPYGLGGGVSIGTMNNCIIYFNDALQGADYDGQCILNYCCVPIVPTNGFGPIPTNGIGNFTNSPLFLDLAAGNLRLQSNSPCINAGNNDYVTTSTDLDGNPRISGGTVDVGAYEFVFPSGMDIGQIIVLVENSNLGTKNKKPLLATLEAALASFDRGNVNAEVNQLHAFQNKVRSQVAPIDSALASELIEAAQQIISEAGQR